jgi:uncharacterized protein YbjT (DUF2867 family)
MKIVVIGGTGLIGSKTVAILRQRGHRRALQPDARGSHASQAHLPRMCRSTVNTPGA